MEFLPRQQRPPEGAQAVLRSIRMLKMIVYSSKPLTLDDIASALELSRPTAHRIALALASEGMIFRDDASKTFTAGPEAIALGSASSTPYNIRASSRLLLAELARQTGETATLEIPTGYEMQIVDEVQSPQLLGARAETGTHWPMHATSSGKAVLASWPDEALDAFLRSKRQAFTSLTIVDPTRFRNQIEEVRKTGFAMAIGELQDQFCAVSAALPGPSATARATISIGGPVDRLNPETLESYGELLIRSIEKGAQPTDAVKP